jgi:hypothetical protein
MSGIVATLAGSGGGGAVVDGATYSGATVALRSDGTTSDVSAPAWFSPSSSGIGGSYWMRLTRTGGAGGTSFSPAAGSWHSLGAGQTVSVGGGAGLCIGTVEFATDSAGVSIVATSDISANNSG